MNNVIMEKVASGLLRASLMASRPVLGKVRTVQGKVRTVQGKVRPARSKVRPVSAARSVSAARPVRFTRRVFNKIGPTLGKIGTGVATTLGGGLGLDFLRRISTPAQQQEGLSQRDKELIRELRATEPGQPVYSQPVLPPHTAPTPTYPQQGTVQSY